MMHIVVTFQDRPPSELLAWTARRAVAHALERFAARVRDITVAIRGGDHEAPAQCSLALQVAGGRVVQLQGSDPTADGALQRLAARAAAAVGDALRSVRTRAPGRLEPKRGRPNKRRRGA